MTRTGAHLKIEAFGSNVQGVRLLGDPRHPEPDEFRVAFPGGDVSIMRCSDGTYWAHVRADHAEHPSGTPGDVTAKITEARLDIVGKHTSDAALGDFAHPGLYHLAVRVARDEIPAPPEQGAPRPRRGRLAK